MIHFFYSMGQIDILGYLWFQFYNLLKARAAGGAALRLLDDDDDDGIAGSVLELIIAKALSC